MIAGISPSFLYQVLMIFSYTPSSCSRSSVMPKWWATSGMPVVIRTRDYGTAESYKELGFKEPAEIKAQMERDIDDLFGPGR